MTDRVRSALFSHLGERVRGARVLDLYSGSGALGIEALSRGAGQATFVERDPAAVATIRSNLEVTDFAGRSTVYASRVETFLRGYEGPPFDLVLIDPPFRVGLPSEVLRIIGERSMVKEEGILVVQISSRADETVPPRPYLVDGSKRYGDSTLLYLRIAEGEVI